MLKKQGNPHKGRNKEFQKNKERKDRVACGAIFLAAELFPRIATPSACYRAPKPQKCPKWLGEGAKCLLDSGSKGPLVLVQKRVAPQGLSAFLKHAFREVTSGFCKGTVPGAPPRPSPGPLRMPKNNPKETYSVPPAGHLSVKNMWSECQVVQRYRTRGAPFPVHKAPRMPKNRSKKTYLVPGPKARLRQGTFEKPWV